MSLDPIDTLQFHKDALVSVARDLKALHEARRAEREDHAAKLDAAHTVIRKLQDRVISDAARIDENVVTIERFNDEIAAANQDLDTVRRLLSARRRDLVVVREANSILAGRLRRARRDLNVLTVILAVTVVSALSLAPWPY